MACVGALRTCGAPAPLTLVVRPVMTKLGHTERSRATRLAAWLGACLCFLCALAIANGVFFSSAAASRYGRPVAWSLTEIKSPHVRIGGATFFTACGLLILLRTYSGSGREPKKQQKRVKKLHE